MQIPRFYQTLFTSLLFIHGTVIFAQQNNLDKYPNTLTKLNYKQLREKINSKDSLNSFIYVRAYLTKAKREKDTLHIAKAYRYHLFFCQNHQVIPYTDSIIRITKNKNYQKYPMLAYYLKGMELYYLRNFKEALDNLIEAKKIAS